jgi:hypothetical protein
MQINDWFDNDGSRLPPVPQTHEEVKALRMKLDAMVGEARRRHIMGEIATRQFFEMNHGLEPGFLTRSPDESR